MADTKISSLAAVTDVQDTDELVLARSGTSNKIDASDLRVGLTEWTEVVKLSDESVASSTALQADNELLFATVSGAIYLVECVLLYGSPAGAGTPDMKVAFGEDSTTRGSFHSLQLGSTLVTIQSEKHANSADFFLLGTNTADFPSYFNGVYLAAGGTFSVLWAQNSSGVNATIVRAGSTIRYRRVF